MPRWPLITSAKPWTLDSDSSWEDLESEEELYPTFDPDSKNWAEEFSNSIRRFHGSSPLIWKLNLAMCTHVLMGGRPHQGYLQPKPFFFAFGIEILYRPLHWITLSEEEKNSIYEHKELLCGRCSSCRTMEDSINSMSDNEGDSDTPLKQVVQLCSILAGKGMQFFSEH